MCNVVNNHRTIKCIFKIVIYIKLICIFIVYLLIKMDSHEKYAFTKTMIHTLVNCNAIIFGGAVRDLFLHNFHATEFYLKSDGNYDDASILPELKERFLVPCDIDLFIKEKDFTRLMRILTIKYFIKNKKSVDMRYRFLCDKGMYTLYKVEALNSHHVSINLDIIVCSNNEQMIPLMETDFDVNRLMYSLKRQYYLRGKLGDHISFHNVVENIKNKRAICDTDIKHYRIDKMIKKGWNIIVNYKIYKFIHCGPIEDKCIVCHIDFNQEYSNNHTCIVRFRCSCKYCVCYDCIEKNGKNINKCVMCRKEYFTDPLFALNEFNFFKDYQIMG